MKKVCVLLFLAASLGTSVHSMAQQGPDLRTQATEATRKLAQQISLDDARSIQVRRFTYERLVQEAEVTRMYADDPAMLQNKMRVVGEEYAEKLKGVLSDAQFQRYATLNAAVAPTTASAPAQH
ncbi:hypothetical protein [Hymenobacter persicinus]|jgi:hypothetical protein|uniref:DUF4168 domain-containing protein n=1 Tax=Hymenobacter persicinus TaxID=2025506 RepID=A0A4Q5L772_9BACT|nr:hypothetical protein [Hymenobacter persicinus]RYU76424.1 hypothetical protein EWM57_18605 [Hymenobacter persicinus]